MCPLFRFRLGNHAPLVSTIRTFGIFLTRSTNPSIPFAAAPMIRSLSSSLELAGIPLYASQTVTTVPSGTRACVRCRMWYSPAEDSAARGCMRSSWSVCGVDNDPRAEGISVSVDRSGCVLCGVGSCVRVSCWFVDKGTQVALTISQPARHSCATHRP